MPTRLNFYRCRCRSTSSSYFWFVVDGWRLDRFDRYRVTGLCSREWPLHSSSSPPISTHPYVFSSNDSILRERFPALFSRSTVRGRGIVAEDNLVGRLDERNLLNDDKFLLVRCLSFDPRLTTCCNNCSFNIKKERKRRNYKEYTHDKIFLKIQL